MSQTNALKFEAGRLILDSPLASSYMRAREAYQHTRYIKRCDVVVDGFPRSANTYAWFALKSTVEPKYVVRGHTHSAATLKSAIVDHKPGMLIVRRPDQAVTSLHQLTNGISLDALFRAYTRFHSRCLTLKGNGLYIAKFEDVVTDFGAVLDDFYSAHGLNWPSYVKTVDSEEKVFDIVEHSNMRGNGGVVHESSVARPSTKRMTSSQVLSRMSEKEKESLKKAEDVYWSLVE